MSAALSVNLMTRGPGHRVAALLALLRPVADEIVVALDDRADDGTAATLAAVADRLIRYPYAEPVDRPIAWLHAECRGRWVLTIDDDELPSAALLEALPRLVEAENVTHYWLPRRWLFPHAGRFLDEPPWWPDYQPRLVLNDPRLLHFPDETHRPVVVTGPSRYLDLPLLHADCLLNTRGQRAAKASRYERLRPGLRLGGRPLNHAYYVPEDVPAARTAPVPAEDRALIAAVLDPDRLTGDGALVRVEAVTRAEIDRHWAGLALPETAYVASLRRPGSDPFTIRAGEATTIGLEVANLGDARWPWGDGGRPEIRLSYRWRDPSGALVVADGLRTPLPADLDPGRSAIVPVHVAAPARPGTYRLELDLVHEHVRWFGCALELPVEVVPARRIGLLLDANGSAELWLAEEIVRLAEAEPALVPVVFSAEELPAAFAAERFPSAHAYLLEGLPGERAQAAGVVAARAALLLRNARQLSGGGRPRGLARGGALFLEGLERIEALVAAPLGPAAPRRELIVRRASLLAARALGVPRRPR